MYIRKFLKWSLVFLAFVAYKHIEGNNDEPGRSEVVYMAYHEKNWGFHGTYCSQSGILAIRALSM
ncbi:MAG: hypothetical protein ISP91_06220 [Pseudomonadales bacterium]|nr:hypothetical protein [Pseudomonadales bacterium]